MDPSTGRARLRQRRIMGYFIEAADDIIKREGLGAVTIRKVADKAGYTSATMYNYFDNLNHLIFLATMNQLEQYNSEIPKRVAGCKNSLEIYLAISECFCEFSFGNPEIYHLLFFGSHVDNVEEYTRQYYELFEDRRQSSSQTLSKIIGINNLYRRSHIMIMDCVDDGYFTPENGADFNEVAMLIYRSILCDVLDGAVDAGEAIAKNMKYYRRLMSFYIEPQFRELISL